MARTLAEMQHVEDRQEQGFGALETARGRLPLMAMDVRTSIVELTARTMVRQTFRNALPEPLEATYIFPLPDRAAVTRLQMRVAGRTIEGDLQERGAAREEYDKAIAAGHRAAIAEEERSGVFSLRVGNIPPGEEATIELTLIGPLPVSDGEATFRFPLVVAPRYTPGIPLDGASVGAGITPDTDEVPDASRITPPVLLPGFPNPVRLSLEVEIEPLLGGRTLTDWSQQVRSSLHSTIQEDASPLVVRLQPGEHLNRDFILRFPVSGAEVGTSLRVADATQENGATKPGVFALTLVPPKLAPAAKPRPRDVVFVLDRSGSMAGWKMVAARRALRRMVDSLLEQDRFAVVAFDCSREWSTGTKASLEPASNRARWAAMEWLGKIDARGGTEMRSALQDAAALLTGQSSFWKDPADQSATDAILVIVTDGQVSGEDSILKQLAKDTGVRRPRVFTVGIDRAVNAGFLKRLADFGGGDCELVESEERLDEAMDRLHRSIGAPVLTNVRLEPLGCEWIEGSVAPARVADLFADRPVTVWGRHLQTGGMKIRVHATDAQGQPWTSEVSSTPADAAMLLSVWGRARVRDLEDQYAIGVAKPQQLSDQIVQVSLESHVFSRFTAYVAVDRTEVVNAGGQQQQVVQPVEMPDGWEMPIAAAALPTMARGLVRSVLSGGSSRMRKAMQFRQSGDADLKEFAESMPPQDLETDVLFSTDSFLMEAGAGAPMAAEERAPAGPTLTPAQEQAANQYLVWLLKAALDRGVTEVRLERVSGQCQVSYRVNDQFEVAVPLVPTSIAQDLAERLKQLIQWHSGHYQIRINGRELEIEVASRSNGDDEVFTVKVLSMKVPAAKTATAPTPAGKKKRKSFWK